MCIGVRQNHIDNSQLQIDPAENRPNVRSESDEYATAALRI